MFSPKEYFLVSLASRESGVLRILMTKNGKICAPGPAFPNFEGGPPSLRESFDGLTPENKNGSVNVLGHSE